ncbi:uncharacterized protein LOC124268892 [Haliotis rubra]|uniref:uncharacterized protein LOC124268892 n=1 Tax=Haliotis rubra TaxID=36100 RepID=UPI001EE62BFB|nr:uncharacterized protein LOC124268892 [Haliotis rubra]
MTHLPATFAVFALFLAGITGHGRLMDPPQRSSMWRDGFNTPTNYDDNQLNCGGSYHQWSTGLGGKCGACGDPYDAQQRNNEPGGRYYSDIISRVYYPGDNITINVLITSNHRGYFEFRLCDNGLLAGDALLECLNKTLLTLDPSDPEVQAATIGGPLVRYSPGSETRMFYVKASLPAEVTCDFCVLQWTYVTGNTWGTDADGTGLGHGPQEHFINCANIQITTNTSYTTLTPKSTSTTTASSTSLSSTTTTTTTTTTLSSSTATSQPGSGCRAVGVWRTVAGMNAWCALLCPKGICPKRTVSL